MCSCTAQELHFQDFMSWIIPVCPPNIFWEWEKKRKNICKENSCSNSCGFDGDADGDAGFALGWANRYWNVDSYES